MGWLERMDRRNQAIVEEQNRAFRAGEVATTGVLGAAGTYGLGRFLVWVLPWSPTTELVLLFTAATVLVVGGLVIRWRRRRNVTTLPG